MAVKNGTQQAFGFRTVDAAMRTSMVREVFESVAPKYDVMNDLMSLGVHRLWKHSFVHGVNPQASEDILDLAGGTGDIAFSMERARGADKSSTSHNPITICDINPAMLEVGKKRAMDKGLHGVFNWVEGNAEELPFADASFDKVTISFGLRNVTHLAKALADIYRVLRVGGHFYCLEFSHLPVPALQKAYDRYSFSVLPWLGEKVANDRASYQYLAESIRAFPDQESLCALMREAGFSAVRYENYLAGVAAVHVGLKA